MRILTVSLLILSAIGGGNCFAFAAAGSSVSNAPEYPSTAWAGKFTEIEQHVVTIENLRVHYLESGTGRTVVVIHGNPGDAGDFEYSAINLLSRKFHVLAIDRPGHGGSDRPEDKQASVEYQAQLLHETLSNLGIKQPVLVGHSWGGSLALCYALNYPDEISGLVLLAPAAYPDDHGNGLLRTLIKTPVVGDLTILLGKALVGSNLLKQNLEDAFYPQTVPDKYFKIVTASWLGQKQLKAYLDDDLMLNDYLKKIKDRYSDIKVPVVIVTGDKDKILSSKDNAYRLQKAITGSRLIELKNTGHEIPQTRPGSINKALRWVFRSANTSIKHESR